MRTKQVIAIIGATERIGSLFAKSISKGNFRLLLTGRDLHQSQLLVNEIQSLNPLSDVEAIDCSVDASWEADIIVLAVPCQDEIQETEKIKLVANQKMVLSLFNSLQKTEQKVMNTNAAERLQKQLPNSKIFYAYYEPFITQTYQQNSICKDNEFYSAEASDDDLQIITELIRLAGFNSIVALNQIVGSSETIDPLNQLEINSTLINS